MAKTRPGITVESAVWERAKSFFDDNPQFGSISNYIENSLIQFLAQAEPVVNAARSGDENAMIALFKQQFNSHVNKAFDTFAEIKSPAFQDTLIHSLEKTISKEVVTTKPKSAKK